MITRCIEINVEEGKEFGKILWANKYFMEYEKMYGMHFTPMLSEWASKRMENRDGTSHYWTREEVMGAMQKMGLKLPEDVRPCDAHYVANMAYADFYGSSLKTEADCLQYAHDYLSDPDGYEGLAFNRWVADMMECEEDCEIPFQHIVEKEHHSDKY